MKITEVRVYPVRKSDDKLKAFATITLEDCFVVRDLKVINGNTGYFIAMPSRKRNDGTYSDVAHPLNSETRNYIEKVVLEEYHRMVDNGELQYEESSSDQAPEEEDTQPEMEGTG